MQLARAAIAADPRLFGRGRSLDLSRPTQKPWISAELRLFATTFIAGFIVVSVLIA